jgi:hypothetical protein
MWGGAMWEADDHQTVWRVESTQNEKVINWVALQKIVL